MKFRFAKAGIGFGAGGMPARRAGSTLVTEGGRPVMGLGCANMPPAPDVVDVPNRGTCDEAIMGGGLISEYAVEVDVTSLGGGVGGTTFC